MRRLAVAILLPAVLGLSACGREPARWPIPESVFNAAQKATADQDWKALYSTRDPEATDTLLLTAYMTAYLGEKDPKKSVAVLDEIMKKHGADLEAKQKPQKGSLTESWAPVVKPVKDRAALFADLYQLNEDRKEVKRGTGSLVDLVVEGQQAKGLHLGADGKNFPVAFVRRGSNWFFKVAPIPD